MFHDQSLAKCVKSDIAAAVCVAVVILGVAASNAGDAPAARDTGLPLVIPHPQSIRVLSDEPLVLGRQGENVTEIVSAMEGGFWMKVGNSSNQRSKRTSCRRDRWAL